MGKHGKKQHSGSESTKAVSKKEKSENLDELLNQLKLGTQKKEPQGPLVTNEEAKARRKKKAQQIRGAKTETLTDDEILKKIEQQQQQAQLQQIIRMLQQQQNTMGPQEILDQPVRTKEPHESVSDDLLSAAVCGMQGWRRSMEDAHCISLDVCPEKSSTVGKHRLFAVFDGHAGRQTAQYASAALLEELKKCEAVRSSGTSTSVYTKNLIDAYVALDQSLRDGKHDAGSGSTACSVLLTPNGHLLCANVGDSRAVLCRGNGDIVELSADHKPNLPSERERIEAAGGFVSMNRVNGQLAMSRALGDFTYKQNASLDGTKQQVISVPDVKDVEMNPAGVKDRFLIIACDGVWDVLSSAQAVAFVTARLDEGLSLHDTVARLVDHCCCEANPSGRGPSQSLGTDNVTAIIVVFK